MTGDPRAGLADAGFGAELGDGRLVHQVGKGLLEGQHAGTLRLPAGRFLAAAGFLAGHRLGCLFGFFRFGVLLGLLRFGLGDVLGFGFLFFRLRLGFGRRRRNGRRFLDQLGQALRYLDHFGRAIGHRHRDPAHHSPQDETDQQGHQERTPEAPLAVGLLGPGHDHFAEGNFRYLPLDDELFLAALLALVGFIDLVVEEGQFVLSMVDLLLERGLFVQNAADAILEPGDPCADVFQVAVGHTGLGDALPKELAGFQLLQLVQGVANLCQGRHALPGRGVLLQLGVDLAHLRLEPLERRLGLLDLRVQGGEFFC